MVPGSVKSSAGILIALLSAATFATAGPFAKSLLESGWTPPDVVETIGRLATVVSRRPDAPRWALVDEHNNVLAFVTPQTGLNLAPLVGQEVSVRGAKGYMPEYKRPYVVAAEARTRLADVPPSTGAVPDRTQ